MKNAILLYGRFPEKFADGRRVLDIPECNPNNENNWMGWTKKELEKVGYKVMCPVIPNVWDAPYSEWKKAIDEAGISEDTVMVGLSAGAGAMVRYIIEEKQIISKLILIAPAHGASQDGPSAQFPDFYDFMVTPETKKQIKNGTTIFVSDDDWEGIRESAKKYEIELDAKALHFNDKRHFSFEIKMLPELVEEIIK